MTRPAWLGAGTLALGLEYVVLLFSALAPLPIVFLLAAAAAVGTELVLSRRAVRRLAEVAPSTLGVRFRVLSLDVLTALLAARLLPHAGGIVAFAIVAIIFAAATRDASGILSRRSYWRRAGGPVGWRNLDVPELPVPRSSSPVPQLDPFSSILGLVIPLGYAIGSVLDRYTSAIVAQWAVIVIVVVLLLVRVSHYVAQARPDEEIRGAVRAAIERAAPELVLHHAGRPGTVEQVLPWVQPLLALGRPSLIVVREMVHLDDLAGCGIPVVCAPRSQDIELFMVGSVDLALYTSDITNINNHLLRIPGVYDVLIGHGDSDEAESRSPIARMYDEIWVAGPLGRQRYASPLIGVPAAKLKEIGPLRVAPAVGGAGGRRTAVYAPSWENAAEAADLSSLLANGSQILEALLARQDVRTLFIPAAPTGARLAEFEDLADSLRSRVAAAGGDHATWPADRLGEAIGVADLVIVDVSPAMAEVVRADVPFAVPMIERVDTPTRSRDFPLTEAGIPLRHYPADVFAALDDALGADRHAADRLEVGRRLDWAGDFPSRFREAVDQAVAVQRRRRAFARPAL